MADGITTASASLLVGGTGVGIAALFPGIDLQSVIGAFGGAFFFVLFAKEISSWQRVGYLVVGWIGGYFAAAEMMSQAWTKTSGLSSFIGGLLCVVVCISLVEAVQTGKPPKWLTWIFSRFTGRGEKEA